ncbi:sensor histidine kinase [Sulfuriferula multivorans]|uniref:histidine kinase n=1 Tax=Sulfuriferula multivorans TaxID=1559896 RepID=A0A401JH06_9PROT|nr:ATP-binding protein [Sulfuriferula multivorans]GBL47280.1 sensor histidine kinase [Sulfuriferula multivorans]
MRLWPASLFGRTAAILGLAFLVFQITALALVAVTILKPMALRSADDLAGLMVLSVQTWVELPPETRPYFERELAVHHHLLIKRVDAPLAARADSFLNSSYIEQSLSRRTGQDIVLKAGENGWVWAEMRMGGHLIRIGFERDRYGVQSPLAAVGLVSLGALLTWLTALVMVRRISRTLVRLGSAAGEVGQGQMPQPLPESGATELVSLTRAFNRMANEVQALLANRTTLLAGISHDLRTPIARMRLALAMLPQDADARLIGQIEHDLEEMNRLIGSFLELSRGLQAEPVQMLDLNVLLDELAEDARRGGGVVEWKAQNACMAAVGPNSLRRVVSNLIENALRYGNRQPITLECLCTPGVAKIRIMDRGPGIPPDQIEAVFRPFYRLETSRNKATGGSGLGLSIAQQLAQANHWQVLLLLRTGGGLSAEVHIPIIPSVIEKA